MPRARRSRSKSASPSVEPAGEARAVVAHHLGGQPHGGGAVRERVPGGLRRWGRRTTRAAISDPGVVIEDVHDPHLAAVGQRPGGGVDLPGVVGRGHSKRRHADRGRLCGWGRPCPGAPAPGGSCATDGTDPARAGQMVGDGLGAVVQRQLLAQPHDRVLDLDRDQLRATTAAAGTAPPAPPGPRPPTVAGTCRTSGGRSPTRRTTPSPDDRHSTRSNTASNFASIATTFCAMPRRAPAPIRCQRCPATYLSAI